MEIALLPGQLEGHVDIITVDDEVVELNKSLIVEIGFIVVSDSVAVIVERPNSSFIDIIDNDGNKWKSRVLLLDVFYVVSYRNTC